MEQGPDELSGKEGNRSDEELDKMTGEPLNSPEKQEKAEKEGPSGGPADETGGVDGS